MLYDSLTGLPNAVLLIDRLQQALAHAARHKLQVGLIYVDVDSFRQVISAHGLGAGDAVLGEVAARLKRCVLRQEDTVARLCGDQFVLIVSDADGGAVRHIMDKASTAMRQQFALGKTAVNLTASMGASWYPHDDQEWSGLLRCASMAMRHAKREGGDRYACFEDGIDMLDARVAERMEAVPGSQFEPLWADAIHAGAAVSPAWKN